MNMLREAVLLWRKSKGEKTISLQLRLFAFFALFILVLALSFLLIMMLSGGFDSGSRECRVWMDNELEHLTSNTVANFGELSFRGTSFAEQLAMDIDTWLQKEGIRAEQLQEHPELLEELLTAQTGRLLSILENSQCSGSFLILDATVNPELENAKNSRSGIFLKRTEPNAIKSIGSKIHYLRGPAPIARANGIELLGQWQLEFDIAEANFYKTTLDTAKNGSDLALSRLYYWSSRVLLKGNSESGMFLCLPLVSRDGTVYGICGLEVSSMLFKLQYSPDNSRYPRIFSTLSPVQYQKLDTNAGLVAGNSYLTNSATGQMTEIRDAKSGFSSYQTDQNTSYVGIQESVKLYPTGSPYESETWVLAVMMPEEDFSAAINANKRILYGGVIGLLILSLVLATFISKRYIRPVVLALDMIKADSRSGLQKTNIAEIDDLLEYLATQDEEREARAAELVEAKMQTVPQNLHRQDEKDAFSPDLSAYEEFVRNIATLSAAERAVFNLYLKGNTAKDISEQLCLSMNTIKTHNKRIYTKLNVTSRKELMVYVQMMGQIVAAD